MLGLWWAPSICAGGDENMEKGERERLAACSGFPFAHKSSLRRRLLGQPEPEVTFLRQELCCTLLFHSPLTPTLQGVCYLHFRLKHTVTQKG